MTSPTLKPRKHPRQARAQQTVAAILEAAAHILEEQGLEGYNTNAIAERAGVSVGSLYQYFPNKDALTSALSRQSREGLLEALDAALAENEAMDFDATLAALCHAAVSQQQVRPIAARLIDAMEERLPMEADNEAIAIEIQLRIRTFLLRSFPEIAPEQLNVVTLDVLHIARGMIDGAAQAAGAQMSELPQRLHACLKGYLSMISHGDIQTRTYREPGDKS
jgi:AcrR family transcriptional regulator